MKAPETKDQLQMERVRGPRGGQREMNDDDAGASTRGGCPVTQWWMYSEAWDGSQAEGGRQPTSVQGEGATSQSCFPYLEMAFRISEVNSHTAVERHFY